jgi:uncharacterized membrane protein YcjF (UPF0283 family)
LTRTLLRALVAAVFMLSGMSDEAKVSDDASGLGLPGKEFGESRSPEVEYWSSKIRSASTSLLSAATTTQSDEQIDSYYASDAVVTVAAMGMALIFLGGLALVGSTRRRRETLQASRAERWRAELMEFSKATSPISRP